MTNFKRIVTAVAIAVTATFLVPASPAAAAPLTAVQYENAIASAVNAARADAGLAPLRVSVSLTGVARGWSGTMASTGSFTHNPGFSTQIPSGWNATGENVAYGWIKPTTAQYEPSRIHQNLMASAGHRKNILRSTFTHLGVGVKFVNRDGANYVYVTQNFAGYPSTVNPDGASTLAGPSVAAKTPFAQMTLSRDATGDRHGDLYAVDDAGRLFLYAGRANGSITGAKSYGTGWDGLEIHAPGDWNGNGRSDLVAVDTAGRLHLYPGDGRGGLGKATQIGHGWSTFRIIPAGDLDGNGTADLLAIDAKGLLWLYPGNGRGGFAKRSQVGQGWSSFDLYAAGDLNGDRRADIVGINRYGKLFFYAGRGSGSFQRAVQVGRGWTGFGFASGADINGDGRGDLVGRDRNGKLWFYAGRANGSFAGAVHIASGW